MSVEYFRIGERSGHWWFINPDGVPFWSIGMNHIDPATLMYAESGGIWRNRFGNSMERWLKEAVAPDLRDWGFNTIGWTQEVVTRKPGNHRHSRRFTFDEYQSAGMPYCHLLPFAETHQWEEETRHPDVYSEGFEDWCDHVARSECTLMADDPKLIGYFYVDCPMWVHSPPNNPRPPWFDPDKLATPAGRKELFRMASRYYQVTHDAIRRYDPNHLILGDRYEGRARLPEEILLAASPYLDVFSFQHFSGPEHVGIALSRWSRPTRKPVLLADACTPDRNPAAYASMIRGLRELACCVGWHVCGAYLKNRCRGHGFRDERGGKVEPLIAAATAANRETQAWVAARATASRALGGGRDRSTWNRGFEQPSEEVGGEVTIREERNQNG